MKAHKANEFGAGTCELCRKEGRYPHYEMSELYTIDGLKGHYCKKCVKKVKKMIDKLDRTIYIGRFFKER